MTCEEQYAKALANSSRPINEVQHKGETCD